MIVNGLLGQVGGIAQKHVDRMDTEVKSDYHKQTKMETKILVQRRKWF